VEQVKEQYRDARGIRWLDETLGDIRIAARSLRKSPGFTTVAILTLALCIGANSAVFSVVHAILLKPYPWPDSDRLVYIHFVYAQQPGTLHLGCSVPDYLDWRDGVAALEESALFEGYNVNLPSTDLVPERVLGHGVTPSLFRVLKTSPALGRTFSEDDAELGAPKTVVLSDPLWRNRFGANPNVIGADIRLNGQSFTVIGVMPPAFYFPRPDTQLWLPLAFTDRQKSDSARGVLGCQFIARVKRGATLEQTRREASAIQKATAERLPERKKSWEAQGREAAVTNILQANVKDVRAMLWLVQGAVAAALLIGCANVASLLLARVSSRERELAVRAALGASRGRLMRHLLTESMLLFVSGGLLGLGIAVWGVGAMNHLGVGNLPRGFGVSLDVTVFAFTLVSAMTTGLAFGALPAWSAISGGNTDALKDAGARATRGRRHLSLRSTLVVTEIALALMLLATASLLIKGFIRLQETSPGFPTENLLIAKLVVTASNEKYGTSEKKILFHNQLLERVRALSGVTAVTCSNGEPFAQGAALGYQIEGYTPPAGREPSGFFRFVSPDYFKTIGVPLLRGRGFTDQDTLASREVVVIDTMMADRYWPGEDPIGQRLIYGTRPIPNTTTQQPRRWEIVGVVASVKNSSRETPTKTETVYLPTLQLQMPVIAMLMVRTTRPASQLIAPLRGAMQSIDPDLPLYDIKTMEARLDESLQRRRTPTLLIALFAGVALVLAAIGVYGVLAFAVAQRTKEIGVRIALGATRANILRLILNHGVRLVGLGLALGLGGYFALSTFIRKMLFSVEPTDYAALLIAPATLTLVALAACLIPARRATKVDPIVALRAE
jgi:putative ABC transport system permease protein